MIGGFHLVLNWGKISTDAQISNPIPDVGNPQWVSWLSREGFWVGRESHPTLKKQLVCSSTGQYLAILSAHELLLADNVCVNFKYDLNLNLLRPVVDLVLKRQLYFLSLTIQRFGGRQTQAN